MEVDAAVVSKLEETLAKLEDGLNVQTVRANAAERNLLIAKMDKDDQAAYATLSKEDKARVIKRIQDGKGISKILDPIKLQIAKSQELPETVRKRLDEADARVAKAEERIAKADERVAKAEAQAELVELSKKAEREFPNLPGTDVEKGLMLRAINGLDKAVSEPIIKMLKAGNESMTKLFIEKGTSREDETGSSAEAQLDMMAKAMVVENVSKGDGKLTFAKAYTKVWDSHPELVARSLKEHDQRISAAGAGAS
jgi:hypothetical protein